ncbi:MAG: S8 family serine peptidase [Verrucomicrobiales bacterium]
MRFSPKTWSLLSIMLFIAAAFFWMKGDELEERRRSNKQPSPAVEPAEPGASPQGSNSTVGNIDLLSTKGNPSALAHLGSGAPVARPNTSVAAGQPPVDKAYPHRLRNTDLPVEELARKESGLLLANALVDTREGAALEIPQHLKAEGDPRSYIVQWDGPVDNDFRQLLANAKAEIVSYVPNNAFLVKASAEQAAVLKNAPGVQSVIGYEPYFKFDQRLLEMAVKNESLPDNALLRLTLFPNEAEAGIENVQRLNGEVLAQEPSPFGPQLVIRPNLDTLAALARLPMVQAIEPDIIRTPANANTRPRVGVSADSVTNANYLGLSGSNVWVNMNDLAIDDTHSALAGRVHPVVPTLRGDVDGHGTFVAGILAGNGEGSSSINFTNLGGAFSNANYRGIAPAAQLLVMPILGLPAVYPKVLDTYLVETAASSNYVTFGRTNAMISNNSWVYSGASEYDSSAARYDAAVRDALLGRTGEQPLLFVFAAGNAGFGSDNGLDGEPGSIFSPGTAKNVITVGALESARFITNTYVITNIDVDFDGNQTTNYVTNAPFLEMTDSSTEVASYSSRGNVGAGREGVFGRFKPDVVAPGTFIFSTRSQQMPTNSYLTNTAAGQILNEINAPFEDYRLDSGTTFAAPVVSGMAALIEEFFQTRASNVLQRPASPALMKAMIINSARSANEQYSLQVNSLINYQGWGLPDLHRAIPTNFTQADPTRWTSRLVDQSTTNALATGEGRTWNVTLSTNAYAYPLRVTLVWTDPPGNPQTGIKLVNDLDLIVTNLNTGLTVYGNDIPTRSDFNAVHDPSIDGFVAPRDFVNNVENIFIANPRSLGTNFSITVRARRVNVNAVHDFVAQTGKINDVVQDFALVVSSDIDQPDVEVFTEFTTPTVSLPQPREGLTIITNGLPLINERIGANASLGGTNGMTNQWRFYVFTNTYIPNSMLSLTNGTNMAFVTFVPPNLSRARNLEADIDLYVSTDSRLTNLNPSAVANAMKSTERGGTEVVAMTNAVLDEVYYVGVKSEDQNGAEYSLMGVSSDLPFEQERNGKRELMGVPFNVFLPDGSPNQPSANTTIAIGLSNKRVLKTVVYNTISHENVGDLVGILSHNGLSATLNNHLNNGVITNYFIYDDSANPTNNSRRTDGPGSLNNFAGAKVLGPWILQMVDNAPSHTGRVEVVTVVIDPLQDDLLPGVVISGTVGADPLVYPITVPAGVTNLLIRLNTKEAGGLLEVALRRDDIPTLTERDFAATNSSPTSPISFEYGIGHQPPLQAGAYYLSVRKLTPFPATVDFDLLMLFEYGIAPDSFVDLVGGSQEITDDALTNSTVFVRSDKTITKADVSLHLDHERIGDLALSLVSPQGTRILLTENRGRANDDGFGRFYTITNGNTVITNSAYAIFTDDTSLAELPVKFAIPPYADLSTNVGQIYTNGFEGATNGNYSLGDLFDGWKTSSNVVSILNNFDAPEGTNFLVLTGGGATHTLPTIKGRSYKLNFLYRSGRELELFGTGRSDAGTNLATLFRDPHYQVVSSADPNAQYPELFVTDLLGSVAGMLDSGWITLTPNSTGNPPGEYTFRTHFSMFGKSLANASVTGQWITDNFSTNVYINGQLTTNRNSNFSRNNFTVSSGLVQGINTLDFVVQNSGSLLGLKTELTLNAIDNPIINMEDRGFAVISLQENGTNSVVGSGDWKQAEVEFVAQQDDTEITFNSGYPGIWIDEIILTDTGIKYYLPEEPLALLNGERALGMWTLEIWDTRLGATVNDALVSWELNLDYAEPSIYAEPLNSGIMFPATVGRTNQPPGIVPGTIRRSEEQYFVFDTCPDTTQVTVTLTGVNNIGRVELLASYGGFPVGNPEKDTFPLVRNDQAVNGSNGSVTFIIDTDSPIMSPLRPGQPLFIAVRNRSISETNSFQIVATDNGTCARNQTIQTLTANNPLQSTMAANEESEVFSYTVSSDTEAATISVEADGDVGMIVSKGTPPDSAAYSYRSDIAGSNDESITITTGSTPTPLSSGEWFVRVYKNNPGVVNYTISVTETAKGGPSTLNLANGSLLSAIVQPIGKSTTSYKVTVPQDATSVLFELYDLGGNADLWVQRGSFPMLSANPGLAPEQIVIRENASMPDISGEWIIVIANNEDHPIAVKLRTVFGRGGMLQSSLPLNVETTIQDGQVRLSWRAVKGERYQVQTSTNLEDWTPVTTLTATNGSLDYSALNNINENARFYRVIQIPQ